MEKMNPTHELKLVDSHEIGYGRILTILLYWFGMNADLADKIILEVERDGEAVCYCGEHAECQRYQEILLLRGIPTRVEKI